MLADGFAVFPFVLHGGEEFVRRDVFEAADRRLTDGVEEAINLRVVRDADHRHAHDTGENQRVKADGNHEVHVADERKELMRAVFAGQHRHLRFRRALDALRDAFGRADVLGVLHRQEHDARIIARDDFLRDAREHVLVMRPAAPFAHGDADDGLCALGSGLCQDMATRLFVNGMDGEHGIGRRLDARLPDAEVREFFERAVVAHRDELRAVHDFLHEPAREPALDRADALRVKHDRRMHGEREEDDAEVVVEAPAARDILQQAAAARNQEVGMA